MLNDASDLLPPGPGPPKEKLLPSGILNSKSSTARALSPSKNIVYSESNSKKQEGSINASSEKLGQTSARPKSAVIPSSQSQQPKSQTKILQGQADFGKKSLDVKVPEERKLELEGTPKNRKVNPLDRVVAKLGGKEKGIQIKAEASLAAPAKNVTVDLTELMKQDASEVSCFQVRNFRSRIYLLNI